MTVLSAGTAPYFHTQLSTYYWLRLCIRPWTTFANESAYRRHLHHVDGVARKTNEWVAYLG